MSSNQIDQEIDGTQPGETQITSSPYLWLLIIDLLIFASLTLTTYTSSKKLNVSQHESTDFRPKFIKALVLANGGKIKHDNTCSADFIAHIYHHSR